jgi:hypothetical protein
MSRQQSILEGLDIPSHGQRQGNAVDKERCDRGVGEREHDLSTIGINRGRIKVTCRVEEGEVISVPGRGLEWDSCGQVWAIKAKVDPGDRG